MATSYSNPGGSGDRRSQILIASAVGVSGTLSLFVDGDRTSNAWFFGGGTTNNILEFWFASQKIIDEATWYQQNTTSHGTWKWQGSNDRITWTDLGSTFTLGAVATQVQSLGGNTTGYLFYRLFQVSGAAASGPWIYEIEFRIDDAGATTSYLNPLSTGNRTGAIITTSSGITWSGSIAAPSALVNGIFTTGELSWNGVAAAGNWVQFDFTMPVLAQQVRFWLDRVSAQGDWKLQGSLDASAWTDLGGAATLGNTGASAPFATPIGSGVNATAYRYYRLLGVSGNRTTNPWTLEVEFLVAVNTTPSASVRATQDAVELLSRPILPASRVTQDAVETLSRPVLPESRVSQRVVEVLSASGSAVPNVVGLTLAAATSTITAAGFTVGTVT